MRLLHPMAPIATIATLALLATVACGGEKPAPAARSAPARPTRPPDPPPPPGRPVPPGDPELVRAASGFLAAPVAKAECGPYAALTDLRGARRAALLALCARLAAGFDGEYRTRLGVPLLHPPRGTIVLFAERARFRAYVAAEGDLPQGYAGFSLAGRGFVALPVEDVGDAELASTLAHELAHLAHRRAFGLELPPWLDEGLADAVADSATPAGFRPLAGFDGAEGLRERVLGALELGRTRPLAQLVALDRGVFDREPLRVDYEQSALFVRFLLLDPELGPRFRAGLAARALRPVGAPPLQDALGTGWETLERRFRSWLGRRRPTQKLQKRGTRSVARSQNRRFSGTPARRKSV